jgi:hypothetical protein
MFRYRYSLIAAALAVLFAFWASGERGALAEDTSYDPEELRFFELLNGYRQENGLAPLVLSDALAIASERHSEDMGKYGFFAHDTAESSYFPAGSGPWDRMKLSGYDYPNSYRAENIAVGYETAEEVFEAWRASPGHNANMLDGDQRVIGIARVEVPGSEYGWYWTTDFGSEVDPTSHAPGEPPPPERSDQSGEPAEEVNPEEPADAPEDGGEEVPDRDGVENGSMKDDSVWKQASKEDEDLIEDGVARLGGYDSARDQVSQKVRAAEGQKLVFRVRVTTAERIHPADRFFVVVRDEAGGELLAAGESTTDAAAARTGESAWIWSTADLSPFAGRTVDVGFLAKTDGKRPTTFFVDDVALKKTSATSRSPSKP